MNPRLVIAAFQTDRNANITKDPTAFDQIYITDIRSSLNSDFWTGYLAFYKNDYMLASTNYANFIQSKRMKSPTVHIK